MKKILFVCTGNTCRSPMAAALLNALQNKELLGDSAGLDAFDGDGISPGTLEALRFTGTKEDARNPYSRHTARMVTQTDIEKADLVVGITRRHCESLCRRFPDYQDRIIPFPTDIPDPFGGDLTVYLRTLTVIRMGISVLYRELTPNACGMFPMTTADISAIMDIERVSFSDPWSESSFQLGMQNPATHSLVWLDKGIAVGYAAYSVLFEDAELYNIAVSPAYRNKGIGKKLLCAVAEDVFTRGADNLHLEVRESNAPARALYEKCGFSAEGKRKHYYQNPVEDAILMCLTKNEYKGSIL